MPVMEFKQGTPICVMGDPMQNLFIITKGSASATFSGRTFRLEQGNVIGLGAISTGSYNVTYTATSDVTAYTYPCDSFETLDMLLKEKPDVAYMLVNSLCRVIVDYLGYWMHLRKEADSAFSVISSAFPQYQQLCSKYAFASKQLPGFTDIVAPEAGAVERWMDDYYNQIKELEPAIGKTIFKQFGIASGFLRKGAVDVVAVFHACEDLEDYLKHIAHFYVNAEEKDMLSLISELHINSMNIKGADATVTALMARLTTTISNMTAISASSYQGRLTEYTQKVTKLRSSATVSDDVPDAGRPKQNLADSMSVILEYSGMAEEVANVFARKVQEFTAMHDRASTEDDVYKIRRELIKEFYPIYTNVMTKYIKDPTPPTVVKMFLEFGYIDPELAGHANADYLYSIVDTMGGNTDQGVYTILEWMTAIYKGTKEPSRDESDLDWPSWLQDQKQTGEITAEKAAAMLNDQAAKLKFELENVFPIANRMTAGRATTFCPLFSDHTLQRNLEESLVTPARIKETFDEILSVDPAAFHRPVIYENEALGIAKENVNQQIMPNIILMPNVGLRGAMWQDIEGRKRNTPGRVFMPIFLPIDLKNLLMRITGEFRWEMCKRIMGMRWNDLSDPSLTAEYCDYLQFYRSNRDLSAEVKVEVKQELVRARNNYRTVFVNNYVEWLLYESNGSPRLTKVARRILMIYCTFPAATREKIANNPQYADPLKQFELRNKQKIQHWTRLINKIEQGGKPVPKEFTDEIAFIKA
ncbi:MAG: cyclic nucleotide-binding domain-containing protein [Defluviitaleaceae bacterium]|nr:cyclic nucleotide-binding domain-containing protein [Defluviitaleaceae bacterium]MCL2274807.1 cyclic nucleotide-binding domain-containing protein [Defluviitaleaceae bacterium]